MDLNQVHVDAVLTGIALEFAEPGFIADQVFPFVNVKNESDKYYKFLHREELTPEEEKSLRAPGADAHEIRFDGDTDVYSCEEYAFKHLVPDRIRDNADAPIRPRARATKKITAKLWLGYELRCQRLFKDTANNPNSGVTTKWNLAGADIEADVDTAKETFKANCGGKPNKMLVSGPVARVIKRYLKLQTSALTLRDEIEFQELPAVVFGMNPILAEALKNTAALGQSISVADVWDDTVGLLLVDGDPGQDSFTFAATFIKQRQVIKTWRDEARTGEWQLGSWILDEKVVVPEASFLLTDVL